MRTVASFGLVLAAAVALLCHCTGTASSTDCSGTAPTMQCDLCGDTVTQTAVCIDDQWSCEPPPSCTYVGSQACGAELCDPSGAYCATTTDGGGACTPYPSACHESGPVGCGCIGFDASACSCAATEAGVTLRCVDDTTATTDAGADALAAD